MIEEAKFTYSPLGKTLGKQRKTIEDQDRKKVETLKHDSQELTMKYVIPKDQLNKVAKN